MHFLRSPPAEPRWRPIRRCAWCGRYARRGNTSEKKFGLEETRMKRSWVRSAATLLLFGGFTLAATAQAPATPPPAGGDAVPHHERPHFPPKTGVQTAGVQHDIAELAPQATFSVEGHPDWMAVADDGVWVTSSSANHVVWLDAKTNQPGTIITVNKPCAGLALGFGSLWIPSCGDHTVVRVDAKTGAVQATVAAGPADSEGGIAVG